MYPRVESAFDFSVTHEIVGKLMRGLEAVVQEINELAEADPDDPHRFETEMTSISLQPYEGKPYMLKRFAYEVSCVLFVKNETGLVEFSKRIETLSSPVGPIDEEDESLLHPNGYTITLEKIYKDVSRFVRHLYADEARKYIWRDGVKKLK